ncbi:MAG: hypothetical protein Ct9H300mP11_32870 [Chloroflexota bacterium]|nr:MAG: hypothetical protein Ct9H300mP11_32870 [Chloroflexota bacterium]
MDDSPQWGTKALPGKRGLTLDDINTGFYGEVPDQSEEMTRMPRGARHVPGIPRLEFYPLSKKEEFGQIMPEPFTKRRSNVVGLLTLTYLGTH